MAGRTRTSRKGIVRLALVASAWILVGLFVATITIGSTRLASTENPDPVTIYLHNPIGVVLAPGSKQAVSVNCSQTTADWEGTSIFIRLDGRNFTSYGGKTVTSVVWRDAANRTAAGEVVNTSTDIADGTTLRFDGGDCREEFPRYLTFVARVGLSDGTTHTAESTVEVKKA